MTSIILAGPLLILTGFLFPSVPLGKYYMVPQVDHDCVLPSPFQLIILQLFYYLILQSELLSAAK